MEPHPRKCLRDPLELPQGERLGQELEDDRPVPKLAAQAAERLSRDAPVVEHHRFAVDRGIR